jgi:ATP-dependent Clp protease protease subunit
VLDNDDQPEENGDASPEDKKGPQAAAQALFKARTILVFGEINQKVSETVVGSLLAMSSLNDDDIKIVVNSPGGHVESADAIHDMLSFIKPTIRMIGTGWVASAGAHIFLGADKENRYCLPNTRFLLHQPLGGVGGPASDISIEAKEIIKMRERLNRIIAKETGQELERIVRDTDRNFWMTAEEAQDYGLVAHIVDDIDQVK